MSSETSLGSTIEPVKIKLSSRLTEITDTRNIQSLIDENAQSLHKNSDIQSKLKKQQVLIYWLTLYFFIILVSQVIESSVVSICVCRESEIVGFGAFDSRKDFENLSGIGTNLFFKINILQLLF